MLVQLVCLDRRYQRMNCYNIREIQTILKSKYAPSSADSSDMHFTLNDTAIGLRYQIGGLDFIDPAMFTYYKHALLTHPRYRAVHEFLHKPILEFDSVKLFMGRCSLMFNVLKTLYREETTGLSEVFEVQSVTFTGGLSSLTSNFLPTSGSSNSLLFPNASTFSVTDYIQLTLYSLHPGNIVSAVSSLMVKLSSDCVRPFMFSVSSLLIG